MAQIELNQLS